MKWDNNGIAACLYSIPSLELVHLTPSGSFYRAAIPENIGQGLPDPSTWGEPVAALAPTSCNISQFFANHSIVFGELSCTCFFFVARK